jgi:hypothetical protein
LSPSKVKRTFSAVTGVTVNVNVVGVVVARRGEPVTVMVDVPAGVEARVLMVKVAMKVGEPVAEGVNTQDAPAGSPLEHDNVTD